MIPSEILSAGLILFGGWAFGKIITKYIHLPLVTAYIIFGIIVGPNILKIVHGRFITDTPIISNIGLGFIAFNIGRSFLWENIKKIGKSALLISIFEASFAFILVMLSAHFFLSLDIKIAIALGALASATAPAATMMVIREYRARGNFTNTLLGVVALDDAWCLIIISLSQAIIRGLSIQNYTNLLLINSFFHALGNIVAAILTAVLLTLILKKLSKFVTTREGLLIYMLSFLLIGIGISEIFNIPLLLTCMIMGGILTNITREIKFFEALSDIDAPIYLMFFTLAGANLELNYIEHIGKIGIFYLLIRVAGKFLGTYIGGTIAKVEKTVKKYLGFALIPQAGVALGGALIFKQFLLDGGDLIFTVIVTSTVIYEIIGPSFTKYALKKAENIP